MDGFTRETIRKNRDRDFAAEGPKALNVISVFMGDENSRQSFGSAPNVRQAFTDLFGAETRVDKEAGIVGLEIGAIAARSASQDGKLNRHRK